MKPTHSEDYYIRTLLKKTKIKEMMTHPVIFINVDEHFSKVARLFQRHKMRHLPVVDEDNKLVGLISQRDLYKIHSPRKKMDGTWYYDAAVLDTIILRHVMNKEPVTLHEEDTLAKAVMLMASQRYGCFPIVDDDNVLCGIITQYDMIKLAAEILKE